MEVTDPTHSSVRATPQVDHLDVTPAMKAFLDVLVSAVLDTSARPYKVKSARAFEVCLALAGGDPRRAMQHLETLLQGLDEWNLMLDEEHAAHMPVP